MTQNDANEQIRPGKWSKDTQPGLGSVALFDKDGWSTGQVLTNGSTVYLMVAAYSADTCFTDARSLPLSPDDADALADLLHAGAVHARANAEATAEAQGGGAAS